MTLTLDHELESRGIHIVEENTVISTRTGYWGSRNCGREATLTKTGTYPQSFNSKCRAGDERDDF